MGALLVIAMGLGGYLLVRVKRDRPIESVAVLPFENKSGNADSEYLSDGLAESLIYRLSQLSNLKVTPRSSAFRYKGKDVDAEKIGNELGVDAVMSGRLIQRGDDLTISVELIDVRTRKRLGRAVSAKDVGPAGDAKRDFCGDCGQASIATFG